jgi:hypothetical protein
VDVAERVFEMLAGTWTLTRAIQPGLGTAVGTASFSGAGPGRLHYREDVELRLATGHVGEAYREYEYLLEEDRIRVLLADGTTMHVLVFQPGQAPVSPARLPGSPARAWTAADVHDCRADQYRGTYRMDESGLLTVDMKVDGPAKDYRILTQYHRPSPGMSTASSGL